MDILTEGKVLICVGNEYKCAVFNDQFVRFFIELGSLCLIIGMNTGILIGGAVLTETIFSLPGLGKYIANAILAYDYPVIQGFTLFFATVMVLANLATDILYVYIDPRIRYR